jgi:plasmid stability protein
MAMLHVRNVPEDLYEKLRRHARKQRRSLSAEVILILQDALEKPARTPSEILTSIQRRRYFHPQAVGAPDSTMLLRADRER